MFGGNKVLIGSNVAYFVLVAVAAALVALRGCDSEPTLKTPPTVMSIRAMPANHLLQSTDLFVDENSITPAKAEETPVLSQDAEEARDKLVGRYLIAPISKGKPISVKLVAERPNIQLSGGAIGIALLVDRKDVTEGRIDAGEEAIACSGDNQVGEQSFVVQAVLCPAQGEKCSGLIAVGVAQRADAALFGQGLAPRLSNRSCQPPQ